MSKRINWLNYLIELIVVIIGITIAFALNNWWDAHKNQTLEHQYLNSLLGDLQNDAAELDTTIQYNQTKLIFLKRFLKTQVQPRRIVTDTASQALETMLSNYFPVFKLNSYESMKNSGDFNLILDYGLKEFIVSYYKQIEELKILENYFQDFLSRYILDFAYQHTDLFDHKVVTPGIMRTHRFRNLTTGYYAYLTQMMVLYQRLSQHNQQLAEKISFYLSAPGRRESASSSSPGKTYSR